MTSTAWDVMANRLNKWKQWLIIAGLLLVVGGANAFIHMQRELQQSTPPAIQLPIEQPKRDSERLAEWIAELLSRLVEILKRLLDREE